jgi:uncharacterized protein YegP (UPF0339 family)
VGEAYKSKSCVLKGIDSIKRNAADADIDDHTQDGAAVSAVSPAR